MIVALGLWVFPTGPAQAQVSAQEVDTVLLTYGFGDPDPLPLLFRKPALYPYNRFDGFTHTPVRRTWKMVVLENEYIRVEILPEMGGKVSGAYDKLEGKPFLYNNPVVKFRDIALRGPWTSGGIEFNFGFIGHTPATAHPVNYAIREGADGSVSCIVGALDVSARTIWQVEIRLEEGRKYFETTAGWQNLMPLSTSQYHWYNTAVKAADDLTFVFPGTHYIGHDGDVHPWPLDEQGHDLRNYREHAFGSHKSLHVLGSTRPFYGVIYQSEKFGMAHQTVDHANPGRKIWTWSLGRDGAIWEDLLTDGAGQYVEVQAGRLFNQANLNSGLETPYGQQSLAPYAAQQWTDRWAPVSRLTDISDLDETGALQVSSDDQTLLVRLDPFRSATFPIAVHQGSQLLLEAQVDLKPGDSFERRIPLRPGAADISVRCGSLRFDSARPDTFPLPPAVRPDTSLPSWWVLKAGELKDFRQPQEALAALAEALAKDSLHREALHMQAEILLHVNRRQEAGKVLDKLLRLNIYDPAANFLVGLIYRREGAVDLARHHQGLAARSEAYRAAAYQELAELSLLAEEWRQAVRYATEAERYQPLSMLAPLVRLVALRRSDDAAEFAVQLHTYLRAQPMNPFLLVEAEMAFNPGSDLSARFGEELTLELLKEIGIWYGACGLREEQATILSHIKQDPGVSRRLGLPISVPAATYTPSRWEEMDWLEGETDWVSRFGTGLLQYQQGNPEAARTTWKELGDSPTTAYFYLVRGYASLDTDPDAAVADLERSLSMNENWRIYDYLARHFLKRRQLDRASDYARRGFVRHPDIAALGILQAEVLGIGQEYEAALALLDTLVVLPYEGAGEGRKVYEWLVAGQALQAAAEGRTAEAMQHLEKMDRWNERLGSGKPLAYVCWLKQVAAVAVQLQQTGSENQGEYMQVLDEWRSRYPEQEPQLQAIVRQEGPEAPLSLPQTVKGYWRHLRLDPD